MALSTIGIQNIGGAASAKTLMLRPPVAAGSKIVASLKGNAKTGLKNLAALDLPPLGVIGAPIFSPTYVTCIGKGACVDTLQVEEDTFSMLLAWRSTEVYGSDATRIPVVCATYGDDPGGGGDFGFLVSVATTIAGNEGSLRASITTADTGGVLTTTGPLLPRESLTAWRCYEIIVSGLTVSFRNRTAGQAQLSQTLTGTRKKQARTLLIGRDYNGQTTRVGACDAAMLRYSSTAWTAEQADAEYAAFKALCLSRHGISV